MMRDQKKTLVALIKKAEKTAAGYNQQAGLLSKSGKVTKIISFPANKAYTPGAKILLEYDGKNYKAARGYRDPQKMDRLMEEFLREMPKTELHLHLEGTVRKSTLLDMSIRHKNNNAIKNKKDVDKLFDFQKSLSSFINAFLVLQDTMSEKEDFGLLVNDLIAYMDKNHIVYTEVYLAMTTPLKKGLKYSAIIKALEKAVRNYEKGGRPRIRFIMDLSRSFGIENAKNNLETVLKVKSKYVIGVGLGGDEVKGPAREFAEVFQKAAENGLHIVAHAGEDAGPQKLDGAKSICDALDLLKAERIGHGIGAIEDKELMLRLVKDSIPLEICLTSNIFTKRYTEDYAGHPVKRFYKEGILVTINSDDPTFFKTDISREYYHLYKELGFNIDQIIEIMFNGVHSTFHPDKEDLTKEIEQELEKAKALFPMLFIEAT